MGCRLLTGLILTAHFVLELTDGQGVYLSLKGVDYSNNSYILITEIISGPSNPNNGLQCITDRMPCCQAKPIRTGEWLFPNRSIVPPIGYATSFYRNRGDDGTVSLNRLNSNVMMPTGKFCCIVPDATSTNVTVCADIVLELPPTTTVTMPTQETIDQSVTFQLISSPDSIDVSFSLICNSTGGLVTSLIWKKDGSLLDNTSPLVLTDNPTASYINILHVNSRTIGAYTCLVRGPSDELFNSTIFNVRAASAPVNVKARQSSASAPVEVSWSPPSGGVANITGYRIFYHNKKNIFVSFYVTSIVFNFVEIKDELGKIVSIRSESTQLPSEPVHVMVMNEIIYQPTPPYSTNVCVAVSLTTIIALAAVVLTTVIFFMCWLRKKRQSKKCEISISTNMSCGQLELEPEGGRYEDPDKIRSTPRN